MDTAGKRLGRVLIVLGGTALAGVLGWLLFVIGPRGNLATLLGIVLVVGIGLIAARFASRLAERVFAPYNVAEVTVSGPIQRSAGRSLPTRPDATPADAIVDQIEAADADDNVEGLIVRLNTPGGEVVPSDDIRRAAASFEGPTIAYATDTCASGGYWIAAGCDSIVAREGGIVGSIGVRGSRITAAELLDTLGLSYERLVAGEYKDAGVALRDLREAEREYLQGLVDDYYEQFIDRVAEGRELDEAAIRETEARVYLASEAKTLGLVDDIGTREDVEAALSEILDTDVAVREFTPAVGLAERLRSGAAALAFSLGAGFATVLTDTDVESSVPELEL